MPRLLSFDRNMSANFFLLAEIILRELIFLAEIISVGSSYTVSRRCGRNYFGRNNSSFILQENVAEIIFLLADIIFFLAEIKFESFFF